MIPDELSSFIQLVVQTLEELKIPYAVTGSFAIFRYGEARTTRDMDIIIDPSKQQLEQLILKVDDIAMAQMEVANEAFRRRTMFNIIGYETIEKIDLIFLTKEAYEQEKFMRRRREPLLGLQMDLVTPEDAIVSKLKWAKGSLSEMQLRDVTGMLVTQWDNLDWNYIEHWVEQLQIQNVYARVKTEAENRLS